MAGLMGLLLLSIGLQLANPQLIERFIDTAAAGGSTTRLVALAGTYLAIAILTQLAGVAISWLGNDVAWRATNQLRQDLMRHCLHLDMSFHSLRTPGEMMERIDGDVTNIANFFALFLVQMFGSAVMLAGILGVMFTQSPSVAGVMTGFVVLSLAAMIIIRDIGVAASQRERQASAELFGFMEERIAGMEDVQANGAIPYVMHRFHQAMRRVFRTGLRAWMLRVVPWNVTVVLYACAVSAVLAFGVQKFLEGTATLGTLYLFYQYTQMLNDPIEQLGNQLQDYQRAKSGMRRSLELLSMTSDIADGEQTDLPESALAVSFDHVTFGYRPDDPVLRDVTFHLQPGERLGVVGRTGSGKSSLSRLLLRLYNPDAGEIRL
ncbi:ABC transporter ATP-binding protein, partial [Alicyclobacillus sp.]|uniref:ABC transporter ATP-binding protein n=1 Tax=Alicyclobacillus sp. TaxID=61169 RepID=UPI0025BBB1EA